MNREYELLAHHFGDELKSIPLPLKYNYQIDKFGRLYKGLKRIKGWKHKSAPVKGGMPCDKNGKIYIRYALQMKNGKRAYFYAHRLVAMAYLGLSPADNSPVLHGSSDSQFNYYQNLRIGTMRENMVDDRLEEGTYFNRF